MRNLKTPAALLAAVLLLAGCGRAVPTGAAATVNGVPVAFDLFERLVRAQVDDPEQPFATATGEDRVRLIAQLQREILTQLVRTEIVDQAGGGIGLVVTEDEVQQRWEQEVAFFQGDEQALIDRIAEIGFTEAEARAQLRAIVLQDRLREHFVATAEVPEDDVRALYEERRASTYEVAETRHILVESEEEAAAVLALLDEGAEFADLAQERSLDDFSGQQGGALGSNPRGQFVPEFDDAVWSAREGEVVGPVETEFGFHVIQVDAFATVTFEEAAPALRRELEGQSSSRAFEEFFRAQVQQAAVEVDARFGVYDPATGEVVARDILEPARRSGG